MASTETGDEVGHAAGTAGAAGTADTAGTAGVAGAAPAHDAWRIPSPEFQDAAAAVGGSQRKSENHT